MAAAADAVKPSPPPPSPAARFVVAALVFALAPMLLFRRAVACRALQYLCLAIAWVISAASAATVVASRVCRKGSAPLVFIEAFTDAAFKFYICFIFFFLPLVAVLLCGVCVVALSGSGSAFKKRVFRAIKKGSTRSLSRFTRAVVLGLVADLAFILLIVAGILVTMMSPPVEESISRGELIGSVIIDVGLFSLHAISCFVIFPALAMDIWRKDQADRKSGLAVADC